MDTERRSTRLAIVLAVIACLGLVAGVQAGSTEDPTPTVQIIVEDPEPIIWIDVADDGSYVAGYWTTASEPGVEFWCRMYPSPKRLEPSPCPPPPIDTCDPAINECRVAAPVVVDDGVPF